MRRRQQEDVRYADRWVGGGDGILVVGVAVLGQAALVLLVGGPPPERWPEWAIALAASLTVAAASRGMAVASPRLVWVAWSLALVGTLHLFDVHVAPTLSEIMASSTTLRVIVDLAVVLGVGLVRLEERRADGRTTALGLLWVCALLIPLTAWLFVGSAAPGDLLAGVVLGGTLALVLRSDAGAYPYLHIAFGLLFAGLVPSRAATLWSEEGLVLLVPTIVVLAVPWLGRVATWLTRLGERPWASVVALNALNLIDASATAAHLAAGTASELNPLVDAGGVLPKVVVVLVASLLLARWRPRVLPPLIAVYFGVTVWHVVGLLDLLATA